MQSHDFGLEVHSAPVMFKAFTPCQMLLDHNWITFKKLYDGFFRSFVVDSFACLLLWLLVYSVSGCRKTECIS